MKTILFLTRHGQTEWNFEHKLDGQEDTQLTAKGIKQAQQLATHLKKEHIDAIICSPLSRSKKTAEMISDQVKAPIHEYKELIEIDCGKCTGRTKKEIKDIFPKLIKEWDEDTDPQFPNGENMQDVENRVVPIFKKIVEQFKGKTIVMVGHGTVNLAFIGQLLEIPPAVRFKISQSNCCINEIHFSNEDFSIKSINKRV